MRSEKRAAFPFVRSSIGLASLVAVLVGAFAMASCGRGLAKEAIVHPLDPLTEAEYSTVIRGLTDEDRVNGASL